MARCGSTDSGVRTDGRVKIVAHHGRFLRHTVGDRAQVAGVDVILAHRLLKNGVTTSRAYVLLTDALLGWLGLDPIELGLVARVESYEHLGDIRCFVHALDAPAAGEVLTFGVETAALEERPRPDRQQEYATRAVLSHRQSARGGPRPGRHPDLPPKPTAPPKHPNDDGLLHSPLPRWPAGDHQPPGRRHRTGVGSSSPGTGRAKSTPVPNRPETVPVSRTVPVKEPREVIEKAVTVYGSPT